MFRSWMRNRLGLDASPNMAPPQMAGQSGFKGFQPEGWAPRPMPTGPMDTIGSTGVNKGIEGWVPKENPYNPPQQTFAAVPDESYSSFGRRPGQALSPYAW